MINRKESPLIENKKLKLLIGAIFLLSVIILTINNFYPIDNVSHYEKEIIGLSIFCAVLLVYSEKAETINLKKSYRKLYLILIGLIFVIFIFLKLYVAWHYSGSYVDEYRNIFAGKEFFSTGKLGKMDTQTDSYVRGTYVSLLAGLMISLFGNSIFLAKLIPAILGIINFCLLYLLGKRILGDNRYTVVLLMIYALSWYTIFSHFFIRMYVFYEFFLLINLVLLFKIEDSFREKRRLASTLYISSFAAVNIISYLLSFDAGQYLIAITAGICLIHWFIYATNHQGKRIIDLHIGLKIVLVITIIAVAFFFLDGFSKVGYLLTEQLTYTSPDNLKYDYLFFNVNAVFTILFLTSIFSIPINEKRERILAIVAGILFIIHMVSSSDLQLTRGILYLIPLYYLISMMTLKKMSKDNIPLFVIMCIILGITIASAYPVNFIKGPYIPGEVDYIDYKKANEFVKDFCTNSAIYNIAHLPYISNFYGIGVNATYVAVHNNTNYYEDEEGNYKTVYGGITTTNNLSFISKKPSYPLCIIISNEYRHSTRYIRDSQFKKLNETFDKKEFNGLNVYYSKDE